MTMEMQERKLKKRTSAVNHMIKKKEKKNLLRRNQ